MKHLQSLDELAARGAKVSLAAGYFDGVHRGHRRVLLAAVARARAVGGEAWVLTFTPHPREILEPGNAPAALLSKGERDAILESLGIDGVVEMKFTHELSCVSAQAFVETYVMRGDWAPEVIFAGENWRFGAGGKGRLQDIPELSGGRIRVRLVEALRDDGDDVSSTRIRAALGAGDVEMAARLLGRPYALEGSVLHGRSIGRTLAAATANVDVSACGTVLRAGVYVAHASWDASPAHLAVVNVGLRPTFQDADSGKRTVEAHLLDFASDLYGKRLRLEFCAFLREERRFESPEALATQIRRDVEAAHAWDSAHSATDLNGWIFHPEADASALQAWIDARGPWAEGTLLQGGRNQTILLRNIPGLGDVVVKHFGTQSAWKDALAQRGLGSKAMRAYRAAAYLVEHGIATPAPLAVYERWEHGRLRESLLISRSVEGLRSFRRELADLFAQHGPCETLMDRLQAVAEFCADMHDAGFEHRDLGNQNLFFAQGRVWVLDLNRGRCRHRPLSLQERGHDLSRIDLPSDLLRVFLEMVWRGDVPPTAFQNAQKRARKRYNLHASTRRLRHPIRERHRAPSQEGDFPQPRDFWIWDERSVQAISAFKSRDRHRYMPLSRVLTPLRGALQIALSPRFHSIQRELVAASFHTPIDAVGERLTIAITAHPDTIDHEVELLRELGARNVLLRLYAHEPPTAQTFTLKAAQFLHAKGFGVSLALVQCRDSILHPASWDALGRQALAATAPFVRWIEVGHAINRVKWGLWGYEDLRTLQAPIPNWKRDFPRVQFTGPGVIDFEIDASIAAIRESRGHLDALSQHLYVDRRGAPENTQNGFNAVAKLAYLRALGAFFHTTHGEPIIVSEFNWPLLHQGVYSPVGSPYVSPGPRFNDPSVTEPHAAAFLIRYALLAICSGHATEMVFWRLDAKGFGLTDASHRRPAFAAVKHWFHTLNGARFESQQINPAGLITLHFTHPQRPPFSISWDPHSNNLPDILPNP